MIRRLIVLALPAATLLVPVAHGAPSQSLTPPVVSTANSVQTPQEPAQAAPRRRRPVTRKTATAEIAGKKLELSYGLPKTNGREFAEVDRLKTGEVVRLFASPALRFQTEVPLLFGETKVVTDNAAPDYPGLYSVWIRRSNIGWELSFNDQADVWGTQYDSSADRVIVPLTYAADSEAQEKYQQLEIEIAVSPSSNEGVLHIRWGQHHWSVPFRVASV